MISHLSATESSVSQLDQVNTPEPIVKVLSDGSSVFTTIASGSLTHPSRLPACLNLFIISK